MRVLEGGIGAEDGVKTVAFSPDGRELLTLSESGNLRFWDVANWTVGGSGLCRADLSLRLPGRRMAGGW